MIADLARSSSQTFSWGQISALLKAKMESNKSALEPRQIGNIMNQAHKEAHNAVASLGGDVAAILDSLKQKNEDPKTCGWRFELKFEDEVVTGIWWQSPLQAELLEVISMRSCMITVSIGHGHGLASSSQVVFVQMAVLKVKTGSTKHLVARERVSNNYLIV